MEDEDAPARARVAGARLRTGLEELPGVVGVRGEGLLLACLLAEPWAASACRALLEKGLVVNAPKPDVLRFAPSLLVSDAEIDEALVLLEEVLRVGPLAEGEVPHKADAGGVRR
jgi:acetylornithine aminotransferase